jgi:GTP-binding protein Era
MTQKKCGYAALVGKPNAGKSTIMNTLLGFKLAAVNPKAQTTRNKITGILTGKDYQVIFLDTPGILEPKYELQSLMLKEVKSAFADADVLIYVVDCTTFKLDELKQVETEFAVEFGRAGRITVLNKIDKVMESDVKHMFITLHKELGLKDVIPIAAKLNFNLDSVINRVIELLPEVPSGGEFLFDPDTLTDRPEKFFVAEIIREKILELYKEEIPYSVFVEVREFKERGAVNKDFINADIILERESQKQILIGKGGAKIKKLGEISRRAIEEFRGKEIFLKLFVKVRKDWRRDSAFLKTNF